MRSGVYHLLRRGARITVEKPMVHPAYPTESCRLRAAARQSGASLLCDFVEAFSQSSLQLCCVLRQLERDAGFRIHRIRCERGKDREDARNPRNYVFDGCSEKVIVNGCALAATTSPGRHQEIILNAWRHHAGLAGDQVRPDAEFAWLVFGLSAALWTSCHQGQVLHVKTEDDLRETMQHYPRGAAGALPGASCVAE